VESGLADGKFASELVSGKDGKFWARASEALIAERLRGKTFPPRTVVGVGPDFLVLDGNRRIWIEIICPEPAGLSAEWLSAPTGVAVSFPHEQILLRWTSAIKEKAEKLIGSVDGKIKGYLASGIVEPDDAYVIAVNGCQLRSGPFPALMGISQFPFAAEAVFPIGPYQLHINRETLKVADKGHQHRPYVTNKNGAQVPAYTFLDSRFNPISAIWAVDLNGASAIGNSEPMVVVHNPNAINPVAPGYLPCDSEYIAKPTGNDFLLEKLPPLDRSYR
jgi:type I restriction enzyme S subunit